MSIYSDNSLHDIFPSYLPHIPGTVPLEQSVYPIYDYINRDSHTKRTITLAQIKSSIAKCLAGNLCRHYVGGKIGRSRSKEKCAVFELLNMYRALCSPCITDEQIYAIQCAINGYCHCLTDCGCGADVTLNPPLPENNPEERG